MILAYVVLLPYNLRRTRNLLAHYYQLIGSEVIEWLHEADQPLESIQQFTRDIRSGRWLAIAQKRQSLFHPLAWDLMVKLLAVEPNSRLTAQQALAHEFFDKVSLFAPLSFCRSSTYLDLTFQ